MKRLLMEVSRFLCAAALAQSQVGAIVIRHDVSDSEYRVRSVEFPEIAYLPGEGHGVLIATNWVLTAAHATTWRPIHELEIKGITRAVEKVVVHPGYKKPPKEIQSGDAAPLIRFLAASDDVALIKLQKPVTDVTPVKIYRGSGESGQVVEIIGAGATGNGLVGQYSGSPHRGELRRAKTRVTGTSERWLELGFEAPRNALPREGMPADGDSGAPVFLNTQGRREAGLAQIRQRRAIEVSLLRLRSDHLPSPCLSLRRLDRRGDLGQMTSRVRCSDLSPTLDSQMAAITRLLAEKFENRLLGPTKNFKQMRPSSELSRWLP